ncbi:MAG: DoxX family protein [Gammaproteobacteria bacterium]|nr:DoxX family protein [Gammaproteobacteria bacterium]MDP2347380.1 DoxX family protein [Gammaproteobacteria bacterium]
MNAIDKIMNELAALVAPIAWPLLRILSSAMFMTHGYAKLFGARPQPMMGGMGFFGIDLGINMLWIAAVIELFGGALLVLGLFTRPLALLAAILMVMAYLTAHAAWFPTLNNGELAAMYFIVYLAIFAQGPGSFSLDARLRGKR